MLRALRVPRASNCDLARTVSWGDGFEGANPCSCVHRKGISLIAALSDYCLAICIANVRTLALRSLKIESSIPDLVQCNMQAVCRFPVYRTAESAMRT